MQRLFGLLAAACLCGRGFSPTPSTPPAALRHGNSASHHTLRKTLPAKIHAAHPGLLEKAHALLAEKPPPGPPCPPALQQSADATGRISVKDVGAVGDKKHDDSDAVRQAMLLAGKPCGNVDVWFPPGEYFFNSTVSVPSSTSLIGSGGGSESFIDGASQTNLWGPADGPVLLINSTGGIQLEGLAIHGQTLGVHIIDSAGIRCHNVGVSAGVNSDKVDTSPDGCDGCNVVLGSNNAAMVVENSFWLWFETTSFEFLYYQSGCQLTAATERPCWGQRPVVIVRGSNETYKFGIKDVYLMVFKDTVISGGGVQYQQTAECGGCATGFWDFFSECLRYYVQAFPSRSPAAGRRRAGVLSRPAAGHSVLSGRQGVLRGGASHDHRVRDTCCLGSFAQ